MTNLGPEFKNWGLINTPKIDEPNGSQRKETKKLGHRARWIMDLVAGAGAGGANREYPE